MPDGLTPSDIAGEISKHRQHHAEGLGDDGPGSDVTADSDDEHDSRKHDRTLSIVEAILLAVVALLAAYTGFASAKWSTKSSLDLASASASRTEANRAALDALDTRNFDSTTFNTWFSAYLTGNSNGEAVAERRFRPAFGRHSMPGSPPPVHELGSSSGSHLHGSVQAAGVGSLQLVG